MNTTTMFLLLTALVSAARPPPDGSSAPTACAPAASNISEKPATHLAFAYAAVGSAVAKSTSSSAGSNPSGGMCSSSVVSMSEADCADDRTRVHTRPLGPSRV